MVKNLPANAGDIRDTSLIPGKIGKIPWRREWQSSPVFLPGESHGQRSLVGYSHRVGHDWSNLAACRRGKGGNGDKFPLLDDKITGDGDCRCEIRRQVLLGRKALRNLYSVLKTKDITLLTKVCIVKAVVFPVVVYGCESQTAKKAEHWRIDAFELWCWRRLLRVPWKARRLNQSILKEINPEYVHKGLMLKC